MSNIFSLRLPILLMAAIAVVGGNLSARSETLDSLGTNAIAKPSERAAFLETGIAPGSAQSSLAIAQTPAQLAANTAIDTSATPFTTALPVTRQAETVAATPAAEVTVSADNAYSFSDLEVAKFDPTGLEDAVKLQEQFQPATTDNTQSLQPVVPAPNDLKLAELVNAPATQSQASEQTANPVVEPAVEPVAQTDTVTQQRAASTPPVPGTTATSSAFLSTAAPVTSFQMSEQATAKTAAPRVAQSGVEQTDDAALPHYSYVGIGINIGITGDDSSLGDANFTVLGRLALTQNISFRPAAVIGNDTTFLLPVTYDLDLPRDLFTTPLPIVPYAGAGIAINSDGGDVAFLLSAGADFPINSQFTATAGFNFGFFDDTSIGLILGVAYNFGGPLFSF